MNKDNGLDYSGGGEAGEQLEGKTFHPNARAEAQPSMTVGPG